MGSFSYMKAMGEEGTLSVFAVEDDCIKQDNEVEVSEFNYSVDKYFDVNDKIFSQCGSTSDEQVADAHDVKQYLSTVTFLSEWRYFQYEPVKFKFNFESRPSEVDEDIATEIHLSQFSSASVPKRGKSYDKSTELKNKDFLLHAGGSVWALDWCPRVTKSHDSNTSFEYLAVSAHPPDSAHHQMGLPLTGRGIIQIWGILSVKREGAAPSMYKPASKGRGRPRKTPLSANDTLDSVDEDTPSLPKKPRQRPEKQMESGKSSESAVVHPKRPRGRPRKQMESVESANFSNEIVFVSPEAHPKRQRRRSRKVPGSTNLGCAVLNNSPEDFSLTQGDEILLAELVSDHGRKQYMQERKGRPRKGLSRKDSCPVDQFNPSVLVSLCVPDEMDCTNATLAENDFPAAGQQHSGKRGRCRKNHSKDSSDVYMAQVEDSCSLECLSTYRADNYGLLLEPSEHMFSHDGRETRTFGKSYDEVANLHQPANVSGQTVLLPNNSYCPVENSENADNSSNLTGINSVCISNGSNILNSSHSTSLSRSTSGRGIISKMKMKNGVINSTDNAFSATLSTININENVPIFGSRGEDALISSHHVGDTVTSQDEKGISDKDITMPRIIFGLAHMGKVAWDVKWRPAANDFKGKCTMGFLAVLLGNGSLEVWEIPLPSLIKKLYTSYNKEDTDPRFLRLKPVFKCSKLSRGGKQSIPLVLEWSPSPPFDLIVAGCHDGSVALWKFHKNDHTQDSNPLACFSAGSDPVRALAWCPDESDGESANLVLTAGHEGLRFWDIRDPYRPLWRFVPVQRHILSVDWLKDLRCILVSYDDGELRVICLRTALSDIPVTGKVFGGLKPGTRTLARSSFAIWSAQASCDNGVIAYCCADGSTKRLEVTKNNIENVQLRRVRRFLCGSLMGIGNDLLIHTPLPNHILPVSQADMKQSQSRDSNKAGLNKAKIAASRKKSQLKADEGDVLEKPEIVCPMGEQALFNLQDETCTPLRKIESFPSKKVAIHKVRWNKNHGSEQWLCYGGAAGIIRCQEITWPIP